MNDSMLLIGSEDVRAGGSAMREAAHAMKDAAAQIECSLQQHRQWADEWLIQFQAVVESFGAKKP